MFLMIWMVLRMKSHWSPEYRSSALIASKPARTQNLLAAFRGKLDAVLKHFELEIDNLRQGRLGIGLIMIDDSLAYSDFRFDILNWRGWHPKFSAWFKEFFKHPDVNSAEVLDA